MPTKQEAYNALAAQKLLPLFYHDDAAVCCGVLQALYNGGVRLLEFTARGPNALVNFKAMKQLAAGAMHGLMLGIGTIKNPADAQLFMDAGADFVVCPTINPAVASVVHERDMLWVPGCMTATEIALAEESGAALVKLFPGNLTAWFDSGLLAVGMGSKLITTDMLQDRDYKSIEVAAARALSLISSLGKPLT